MDVVSASSLAEKLSVDSKQLKELRHSTSAKTRETADAIGKLVEGLRLDTCRLILEHPVYAVANDAHGKLWHNVYYKQIETYRKSIVKHAAALKEAKVSSGEAPTEEHAKKQDYFVRLVNAYTAFLSETMVFFQDMLLQLEDAVRKNRVSESLVHECNLKSMHKCLLSLGDLARYRESVGEGKEKTFEVAYRYYERAAFLVPKSGNPQNQLAVLATYSQTELVAVYHYCRSILVAQPFSLGYTNLATLFGKNERAYAQALLQANPASGVGGGERSANRRQHCGSNKTDIKAKVHFFILQFIRIQGHIFDWAASKFQLLGADTPISTPDIDVEEFTTNVHAMLDNFENVLTQLSDALLVRLVVICIFSVHESVPSPSRPGVEGEKAAAHNRGPRTTGESLGLVVIYSLIKRIASQLLGDKKKSLRKILLPPFSVFAEWSSIFDEYLVASGASLEALAVDGLDSSLHSNAELLRLESRSRSSMRSAINLLDKSDFFFDLGGIAPPPPTMLLPGSSSAPLGAIPGRALSGYKVLPEHLRLRGFLPLASQYEQFFAGSEPIPKIPPLYNDDESRDVRMRILKAFVRDWLIPCAQREAVEGEGRRREEERKKGETASPRGGDKKKKGSQLWTKPGGGEGVGASGNAAEPGGGNRGKSAGRDKSNTPAGKRVRSGQAGTGTGTGTGTKGSSEPQQRSGPPAVFAGSQIYAAVAPQSDNPFNGVDEEDVEESRHFQYDIEEDGGGGGGGAPSGIRSRISQKMDTSIDGGGVFGGGAGRGGADDLAGDDDDDDNDDDDDDVDDVVFRPNYSRTFCADPAKGLQPSISLTSMQSNASLSSSASLQLNQEDDDATLLLASASLGDWLGLSALGRETHAAPQAPWWASNGGGGGGCDGMVDLNNRGWDITLETTTPPSVNPPPGFIGGSSVSSLYRLPPNSAVPPGLDIPFTSNPFLR